MNICKSVNIVPPREYHRESKYLSVFHALVTTPESQWLPVKCRSANEATGLQQECRRRGLPAQRRKKVVFVQGAMKAVMELHGEDLPDAPLSLAATGCAADGRKADRERWLEQLEKIDEKTYAARISVNACP